MATPILNDLANQKAVTSLTDPNPMLPPDIQTPGNYNFDLFYLDYASPFRRRLDGAQLAR